MKLSTSQLFFTASAILMGLAFGQDNGAQDQAITFLDCASEYHRTGDFDGGHVKLSYTVILDEDVDLNNTEVAPQGYMSVELVYHGFGYVSLGVASSTRGRMSGGEAVIGAAYEDTSRSFVLKYDMPSHHSVDEMPTQSQTLTDASVVRDLEAGTTTLRYKKRLVEDSEHTIHGNGGLTTFLWAYGYDNSLVEHKDEGAFSVRLTPCIQGVTRADGDRSIEFSSISTRDNYDMWVAHGVLAGLAWGLFAPLAILASLLRKRMPSPGMWIQLHKYLLLTVVICTIVSLVLAVVAISDEGGLSASDHDAAERHELLGYILTGIVVVQCVAGLFRPAAPTPAPGTPTKAANGGANNSDSEEHDTTTDHKTEDDPNREISTDDDVVSPATGSNGEKTKLRFFWEIGHRFIGMALLAIVWYQVDLGIYLADDRFGSSFDARIIWWVGIGIAAAFIILLSAHRAVNA